MPRTRTDPFSPADRELYEAFFQDRTYLRMREKMAERRGISFNGWALLFGVMWFVHRKMYLEATLVLMAKIAYEISEEQVTTDRVTDGFQMGIGMTLVFGIVLGYVANPIYLSKARRAVARAKARYADPAAQKVFLQREGGTASAVQVIIGFIALMAVYLYDFFMN